jgi:chemotaxis protein CheX
MNVKEDAKIVKPFLLRGVRHHHCHDRGEVRKALHQARFRGTGDGSGIIRCTGTATHHPVTFSESAITAIVSNMLGEAFTEMNQDVKDAVGELTNMISGQARAAAEIGLAMNGASPRHHRLKPHIYISKDPLLAFLS